MIGKIHIKPVSQREITNGVIDNGYTVDSSNEYTSIAVNSFVQIVDSQNKKVIIATDQIDGVTMDSITTTKSGRIVKLKPYTGGAD